MEEPKYPKVLGSGPVFRSWRMDEGTSLQPEARHLGGGIQGATSLSQFVLSS